MTDNENWQEDFDNLPFKEQMKVQQSIRNMEKMSEHIEEFGERLGDYMTTLYKVSELGDNPDEARKILVLAAERFENHKPLPTGEGMPKEEARELDWLRHCVDEIPELIEFAVDTLTTCIGGDFDAAWRKFHAVINVREDEFSGIVQYWKDALEE